jgi:4-hydroxy-2-oxoheptanedioate aldolase
MARTSLRRRLRQAPPVFCSWSCLPGALLAEALARTGFDGAVIDLQHGLIGFAELLAMMAALEGAGKPVLVRPPLGDAGLMGRALDAGCEGLIAPMINTVEEARALVRVSKYPPLGERSWGPLRALPISGLDKDAYLAQANRTSLACAMIETRAALDNLDAIAGVRGLDGLLVGPSDLTLSLSHGKTVDAWGRKESLEAIGLVAARARERRLIPAIYALDAEQARGYAELGFRLIAFGSDVGFLLDGAQRQLAALRRE